MKTRALIASLALLITGLLVPAAPAAVENAAAGTAPCVATFSIVARDPDPGQIDLRVDDHTEPLKELHPLLDLHAKLFGRPVPQGRNPGQK